MTKTYKEKNESKHRNRKNFKVRETKNGIITIIRKKKTFFKKSFESKK